MGACAASLLGIEVRHLPVLFVLSLLCVIVSSQHVLLTPIGVCSKQKKMLDKKTTCIAMLQMHLWQSHGSLLSFVG